MMLSVPRALAACLALFCAIPCAVEAAVPSESQAAVGDIVALDWPQDLTLTVGSLLVYGLLEGPVKQSLSLAPSCALGGDNLCASDTLWRGDRSTLQRQARRWRQMSDVLQVASVATGLVAVMFDGLAAGPVHRWQRALGEGLVYAEAVAVGVAATNVLKWAVRRPRPGNYREPNERQVETQLSFPSGHTTTVAAASAASITLFALRHREAKAIVPAAAAGVVLTALTATGRLLGGRHFVTDVLAGAAVGATAGFVLPFRHRVQVAATSAGAKAGMLQVSVPL